MSFPPVANITDDSKDFPTIPVVIGVCAGVGIVAVVVIVLGGIYFWYHKKNRHDGNELHHVNMEESLCGGDHMIPHDNCVSEIAVLMSCMCLDGM